jgi:uncharacterized membrane protein YuzA (DUF378 family)
MCVCVCVCVCGVEWVVKSVSNVNIIAIWTGKLAFCFSIEYLLVKICAQPVVTWCKTTK